MRIALLNEVSQCDKNQMIYDLLSEIAFDHGHGVYNLGQTSKEEAELSYVHIGALGFVLIASGAMDFIVSGCGTGQGVMLSLNSYPLVQCGLIYDPVEAELFEYINDGNAISIPYAKGFGWGGEVNLRNIFEKLLSATPGGGYPAHRAPFQQQYAQQLRKVKAAVAKAPIDALKAIDPVVLCHATKNEKVLDALKTFAPDSEITKYVLSLHEDKE